MSDDPEDQGGSTLVMSPEERPPMPEVPRPAGTPLASPAPADLFPKHDSDAPGTFIMTPEDHAAPADPSSPYVRPPSAPKMPDFGPPQAPVFGPAFDPALARTETSHGPMVEPPLPQERQSPQPFMLSKSLTPPPPQQQLPSPAAQLAYASLDAPVGGVPFPEPGAMPLPPASQQAPQSGLAPLMLGASVGLLTVVLTVGGYYLIKSRTKPAPPEPTPTASAAATTTPTQPAPPTTAPVATAPLATGSASPKATAPSPEPTGAEAAARAALDKLAKGIDLCVGKKIHAVPGTSNAVPPSVSWLKKGPYKPNRKDFDTPVFHCAEFKLDEPMPFVIQFQADVPRRKGTGIAWLDDDGDGKADRALGFVATMGDTKTAQIGPIESLDAKRPVKKR
jgi:hypothetical protein